MLPVKYVVSLAVVLAAGLLPVKVAVCDDSRGPAPRQAASGGTMKVRWSAHLGSLPSCRIRTLALADRRVEARISVPRDRRGVMSARHPGMEHRRPGGPMGMGPARSTCGTIRRCSICFRRIGSWTATLASWPSNTGGPLVSGETQSRRKSRNWSTNSSTSVSNAAISNSSDWRRSCRRMRRGGHSPREGPQRTRCQTRR